MTNADGSCVKVVVRIRPETGGEEGGQHCPTVQTINDQILVFDPADDQCEINGQRRVPFVRGDITKRRNKNMSFAFDHVFGPESVNLDLYEHTSKSILDGLLNGYNCSVFAYGATGAGKTYTMLGTKEQPGITFLTLMDLYQRIEAIKLEKNCDVAVSYLEIYNEQIKDLLSVKSQLPIREDPKAGIIIPGLSLHKPRCEEDLLHLLYCGNQNRTQHPTDANAESSRSHAVFQVFVKQSDRTANLVTSVHVAKMSLVDLAGSERGTVTRNQGPRMREGANINRSLLALGNVINALADNKIKAHVPYRDSKLTRLLKDSIGGNCRTVMIAAVSPSLHSYEDTYNTLKYADRAKNIRTDLKKNIMNVKSNISKYGKIVEDLRQEVQQLKNKLKGFESGESVPNIPKLQEIEEDKRLQEELYNIFKSRKTIRKQILGSESASRWNEWKILCKSQYLARVNALENTDTEDQNLKKQKIMKGIEVSQRRIKRIDGRILTSHTKFAENEGQLQRLQSEMTLNGQKEMSQILAIHLRSHHLEVELGDTQYHNEHLQKLVNSLERENNSKDKLINTLYQTMKKCYSVLKGHDLLCSDLQADFNQAVQQALGEKEVMWADETSTKEGANNVDGILFEKIIELPVLRRVILSPSLDNTVKERGASLTPILTRTKCFLNDNNEITQVLKSTEYDINRTPKLPKRAHYDTDQFSAMKSQPRRNIVTALNMEQQVCPKLKTLPERVKLFGTEATKSPLVPVQSKYTPSDTKEDRVRRVTESRTQLSEVTRKSEERNVIKGLPFKKDPTPVKKCSFADAVKSPVVVKGAPGRSPLTSIVNYTPSPLALPLSPDNLPSTRDAANLNLAGGATITKTKPTLQLKSLPVNKVKPLIYAPCPAAKENIKALHRYGLSSLFDRQTLTGGKKLQRTTSQKLIRSALPKTRIPSSFGTNGSQKTTFIGQKWALSDQKPRRSLFRSKSASDLVI